MPYLISDSCLYDLCCMLCRRFFLFKLVDKAIAIVIENVWFCQSVDRLWTVLNHKLQ